MHILTNLRAERYHTNSMSRGQAIHQNTQASFLMNIHFFEFIGNERKCLATSHRGWALTGAAEISKQSGQRDLEKNDGQCLSY